MNMEALQQLASQIGMHDAEDYASQKSLVRAIQKYRGDEPCFLTDKRYHCDESCEWSEDCKKLRAVWLR